MKDRTQDMKRLSGRSIGRIDSAICARIGKGALLDLVEKG